MRLTPSLENGVSDSEFTAAMAGFGPLGRIAVAVSGGGDSIALMLLLKDWAKAAGHEPPLVLCVDHGMRPAAKKEAEAVARRARRHGLAAQILRDPALSKPKRNLQAELRKLRYRLLSEACARAGVRELFLAHTQDDQAETFLLRLARGSGVDGLAAMAPTSAFGALALRRPLLAVSRARLRALLKARGEDWIEDPSNLDPRHGRTRWRALMPQLAAEGVTAARLGETASAMARASAALKSATAALLQQSLIPEPYGSYLIDPEPIAAADQEIALRALASALRVMGGGPPLERDPLIRLHAQLIAGEMRACTLRGCRILPFRNGIRLVRELRAAAQAAALSAGRSLRFDNRFAVHVAEKLPAALRLEILGSERWRVLKAKNCDVPPMVGPTLPAVVDAKGVRAVPLLGVFRSEGVSKEVMIRLMPLEDLSEAAGSACLESGGY